MPPGLWELSSSSSSSGASSSDEAVLEPSDLEEEMVKLPGRPAKNRVVDDYLSVWAC